MADLENLGDLSVIATLIQRERLLAKAGWDASWVLNGFPVATLPTPKTAEALVNYTNGSLACGGVMINPIPFAMAVQADNENQLAPIHHNYERKRAEQPDGVAVGVEPTKTH